MTTTTANDNLSNLSTEDVTSQVSAFLKEHGEIEMILPVAVGVLLTSRLQLRGANALLANLLIASLLRQIFTQLKQETPPTLPETSNSSSTVADSEAAQINLDSYAIAHAVPGRVRLKMPQLAIDADFARRLQQALMADEYVNQVRVNPPAASIAINYNNQGLSDWDLGLRLMGIINNVRQEH
ncbi:metal ABC transporter ATPase [Pleurocapsales cyanobacterium LEGE 10410]|nr:metal ABC transporter ATPase [Pleurocapsales cyanobacterium LEGE 10410]